MNRSNFSFLILILCLLLISSINRVVAQETFQKDSLKEYKPKMIFAFDARRSFMFEHITKLSGLKIGLQIQKKHGVGISFYNLRNNVLLVDFDETHNNASIDFGYVALFYEYELFNDGRLEFWLPIHFGGGSADVQLVDSLGNTALNFKKEPIKLKNIPFRAGEVSFVAEYKIHKWFGVGAGFGFRKVWAVEDKMQYATTGPIYSLKAKIYLGEIYRDIKKLSTKKQNA